MQTTRSSFAGRLLLVGAALLPLFAATPDPAARTAAEIRRIDQAAKASSAAPGMADIAAPLQASLRAADEALQSGRIYLALEKLAQAADLFEGAQEMAAKADSVTSVPAFEAEWKVAGQDLAALSHQVHTTNWSRSPAAVRALSEASLGRSLPLLDGGRGFAIATGPHDG